MSPRAHAHRGWRHDSRRMSRPRAVIGDQRGQSAPEYMGVLLVVGVIIAAIVLAGLGGVIGERMRCVITEMLGGQCAPEVAQQEPCVQSSSLSTSKLSIGVSVKLVSGEASNERVVLKESFSDGTAGYTITDRASLQAALGSKGGGVQALGQRANLTAALAAGGTLQNAEIYESSSPQKTREVDEALAAADGFAERTARSAENLVDLPREGFNAVTDFLNPLGDTPDVPDIDGALLDRLVGELDLGEPVNEYVGGEGYLDGSAGFSADRGVDEADARVKLRGALGGLHYTSGERRGETELYFRLDGNAGAQLQARALGQVDGDARGKLVASLVLDDNRQPIRLRIDGYGQATGLAESADRGSGLSRGDRDALLADSDETAGTLVTYSAELDLTDPANLAPVLDLLSPSAARRVPGALGVGARLAQDGELEYGLYDAQMQTDNSGVDVVVFKLQGDRVERTADLVRLVRKAPGVPGFESVDCR